MRENTQISLPAVKLYDTCDQNLIGFEYVLEEFGPPQNLESLRKTLSMTAKEKIVKSLAEIQAELFGHRFQGIGNLHPNVAHSSTESMSPHQALSDGSSPLEVSSHDTAQDFVDEMVSMGYLWTDNGEYEPEPGPFHNSFQWLKRQLDVILSEQNHILQNTSVFDHRIRLRATEIKGLAQALLKILPKWFDSNATSETSILFHGNLSMSNILIKEDSKLPYIVDWECASTLPLWMACQLPDMLKGKTRTKEPRSDGFLRPLEENPAYLEELLEYERGQLRRTFEGKMTKLGGGWMYHYRFGAQKRDFELAVRKCKDLWASEHIQQWINRVNDGETISLDKVLYPEDGPSKGMLG